MLGFGEISSGEGVCWGGSAKGYLGDKRGKRQSFSGPVMDNRMFLILVLLEPREAYG